MDLEVAGFDRFPEWDSPHVHELHGPLGLLVDLQEISLFG